MTRRTEKLVTRALQGYWRLTRSLTLGAQGCVVDSAGRVLLIRHTYRPGWHFPGGGVEKGELIETALARELAEEANVFIAGQPELFGLYANFRAFPNDHVALFIVRDWTLEAPKVPDREIAATGFFEVDRLPDPMNAPTLARIEEIFRGAPRRADW